MSAPDVGIDIKFIGGPELMACLREEVPRVAKNALRTGLFRGAKIVETAARADAPRSEGVRSKMSLKYGPLFKRSRRGAEKERQHRQGWAVFRDCILWVIS